jgi:hypothetical protein
MTRTRDMLAFAPEKGAMHRPLLILLAALVFSPPAVGETPDAAVAGMVGGWEISNADREKACNLTLKDDPAKGGFRVEFEAACAGVFPATKDVEAWILVRDDLRLLDARGRIVFDFTEVESGMYEAERGNEGLYFLQSHQSRNAAGPPARAAGDMFGNWTIARAGKPVCTLTLTDNGAGGEMGYALRVQPGCDNAIGRFALVLWRMDRGEIVLFAADGQSLRFEEAEPDKWQRVPDAAGGMTMSRK